MFASIIYQDLRRERKRAISQIDLSPHTGAQSLVSDKNRKYLSEFIGQSVSTATRRTYDGHWDMWKSFLLSEMDAQDPFLRGTTETEKASLVSLFICRRYQSGFREKTASAVTAGIRMHFMQALEPTEFLDSAIISTARHSCRLTPTELRAKRNSGASTNVKLPVCVSMLTNIRVRLWDNQPWHGDGLLSRMTYLACMWGFDQSARISEYTAPEPRGADHCIRVDDLTFYSQTQDGVVCSTGSALAKDLIGVSDDSYLVKRVIECRASSKGKVVVKPKVIGRRSQEESLFLEQLILFVSRSGALGVDELFSVRSSTGVKRALRGRTVREEIKSACTFLGLPPIYFSSHSLRKGGITHMRASGATEDDRRDRGNYAPGSQVMNQTYDYATGLGPLAANSLPGGYQPSIADVQRLLPAKRGSVAPVQDVMPMVYAGEGHRSSKRIVTRSQSVSRRNR